MSSEILGEPPVVDHPVDGKQPELVSVKIGSPDGEAFRYPQFTPKPLKEAGDKIAQTRSQKFAKMVLLVAASLLGFGFFLGIGAGYSIWG